MSALRYTSVRGEGDCWIFALLDSAGRASDWRSKPGEGFWDALRRMRAETGAIKSGGRPYQPIPGSPGRRVAR